ncbi:MAG TPA: alpha/beta hydrolase-fold protein [Gammaproteobacteria bacterium]
MRACRRLLPCIAMVAVAAQAAQAEVSERIMRVAGTTVGYKLVLPNGYDAAKTYPAILVFGGGPQTMNTIEGTLARNFQAEAERRGYIVIGPAAPDGDLFFYDGDRIFPEFLDNIRTAFKIDGGKFHVAGPSNGGIAAMHVAAKFPEYFLSATAFPGYLWQPTEAKLRKLEGICAYFYVGEHDEYRWHDEMAREAEYLSSRASVARYTLEKGQPHRIETLAGDGASRLFDGFEAARQSCRR